jgi:integrase
MTMVKKRGHPRFALTPAKVRRLKQPGMHADGNCLFLRIEPTGSRRWVLRLMMRGRRFDMGLGSGDLVSLADARELAIKYRALARDGIDPIAERLRERRAAVTVLDFETVARQLIESKQAEWRNEKHRQQWTNTLVTYAYPKIGGLPVDAIDTEAVLSVVQPIWTRKTETAKRVRMRIEAVLDHAKARGMRQGDNPARWKGHLSTLLAKPSKVRRVEHHAAMDWREVPDFMQQLALREGVGARALAFAVLTASRSGEVRGMTWGEVDLEDGVWTVPASRMKANVEHRVPLTAAAVALLGAPGKAKDLVFPGMRSRAPLSDMSLTAVLKRMGLGDLTVHGFRATFKTWAGETTAHPREVIEHALAHKLPDKVEAAYSRGSMFQKRRVLMADWSAFATGQKSRVHVLKEVASA